MKPFTAVYFGLEQVSLALNIYQVFLFIIYEVPGKRAGLGFMEGIGSWELLFPSGGWLRATQHRNEPWTCSVTRLPHPLLRLPSLCSLLWLPPSEEAKALGLPVLSAPPCSGCSPLTFPKLGEKS